MKNESLVPEKSLQTKEDVVINSVHNEGKVAMVEDKNLVPDNERKEKKEPQEDKIEEKITWSKEEELQIDSETPDAAFLDDHGSYRIPFPVLKRLGSFSFIVQFSQCLGESEELRRTLESVRLQEKIKGIPTTQNSAPYRLNEALMDPDFEDVVDLMLKIVGVRDEDGNSLIPQ